MTQSSSSANSFRHSSSKTNNLAYTHGYNKIAKFTNTSPVIYKNARIKDFNREQIYSTGHYLKKLSALFYFVNF